MIRRTQTLMASAVFILAVQAVSSYAVHREPFLPSPPPLATFPSRLGEWTQIRESVLDPEVLEALGPDDTLSRTYALPDQSQAADLFIAYYKTQLREKNAHDPKVCLPGAGWNPRMSRVIEISLPGSARSFPANYYRIAKESEEAVVLYWFQTPRGVHVFEQQLRFHRMLDAIVDNRTDMALVRIVAPIGNNGVDIADARAMQLAPVVYLDMLSYFPARERAGS